MRLNFDEGIPPAEYFAYHVAGHVAMALILGRPVHRASLRPAEWCPNVDYDRALSIRYLREMSVAQRPKVENDALVMLAGRAAECECAPGVELSYGVQDCTNALTLLTRYGEPTEVARMWWYYLLARAQAILQTEWRVVYLVAKALCENSSLDHAQLTELLGEARRLMVLSPDEVTFVIVPGQQAAMRALSQHTCVWEDTTRRYRRKS